LSDIKLILSALSKLRRELGDDADRFININELYTVQPLMNKFWMRKEHSLASQYLPGWGFENVDHFVHMMKTGGFRFNELSRNDRPKFGDSWWIRSILVPNKRHYLAELAFCLQKQYRSIVDEQNENEKKDPWLGWTNTMKNICGQEYMAGAVSKFSKPNIYHPVAKDTMFRWAKAAPTFRKSRLEADPSSGWIISHIALDVEKLDRPERVKTAIDFLRTGY